MKSYDLNLLRALHALLETGSVTAAAERLHLSVPAMSHTLARLREAFGDPLLVRAGRSLAATPRALALREPVAQLVGQADALLMAPDGRALGHVARAFVLRAPDGFPVVYGAALAQALQQEMPRSTLQFLPEAHGDTSALREGRIDLDLGSIRQHEPEVRTLELSRQGLVVAMRSSHPLAAQRLTARRYAEAQHVAVMRRPQESSEVDEALQRQQLRRFVALTVPSVYAALIIAARSELIATTPERLARAMAPSLGLHLAKPPLELAAAPVVMAWHPRNEADPAQRWLRDTVRQLLSGRARQAQDKIKVPAGRPARRA